MNDDLAYRFIRPDKVLSQFVERFWSLKNKSANNRGNIVPDGNIDLFFAVTTDSQFRVILSGLETKPRAEKREFSRVFAISFRPLAIEYVFKHSIADILDSRKMLANDFWNFSIDDLHDFDLFCQKASQTIHSLLPAIIDERKRQLFDWIYTTNGAMPVKELSGKVYWSSRQINRYFSQQFGLSLKAYCSIIRFRSSFPHIKAGKLFPEQHFADQSHFIREVKKLSGVSPKQLSQNKNGRFIQFSTPDPE